MANSKRILVIDDEDRLREVVIACLEDIGGWETIGAGSGKEGLRQAEKQNPDAILLDISMPDVDGFTIFKKLQSNPKTKAIPVILLTAKVLPNDWAKFSQMGVAGVVTKPFNPLTLCEDLATIWGWN